jgi:hypothetical protein
VSDRSTRADVSPNLTAFTRAYSTSFGSTGIAEFVNALPGPEARWYRFLGERSDAEVAAWTSKPFLAGYLEAAGRIRLRSFGVLALSYLHLAYDFPRFLADSFREFPDLEPERRYRVYVRGAHPVRAAIVRESRRSVVGIAAVMTAVLPRERPLTAGWILAHRCAAWAAAEALAAAGDRAALDERLWTGIERAGRVLLRLPPWRWMRELPYSSDLVASAGDPRQGSSSYPLPRLEDFRPR